MISDQSKNNFFSEQKEYELGKRKKILRTEKDSYLFDEKNFKSFIEPFRYKLYRVWSNRFNNFVWLREIKKG